MPTGPDAPASTFPGANERPTTGATRSVSKSAGVTDADTDALRALNALVHKDERVTMSLLPVGDGLTLALKR